MLLGIWPTGNTENRVKGEKDWSKVRGHGHHVLVGYSINLRYDISGFTPIICARSKGFICQLSSKWWTHCSDPLDTTASWTRSTEIYYRWYLSRWWTSWTSFNHNTSYLSRKPADETKRSDDQTVDWAGESISPCARDAYVSQNLVIFSLDGDACINK